MKRIYAISRVLLVIGWTAVLLLLLLFQSLMPAGGTSIYPFLGQHRIMARYS